MPNFWTLLSAVTLLTTLSLTTFLLRGMSKVRRLADSLPELPPLPDGSPRRWPSVSIIVAARNEEAHVEAAARSLLAQDYDDFEVLIVNDRSTDRTGEILQMLAAEMPRLTIVNVELLPPGWLGKNHALHLGAQKARGDLLLFTDADVSFAPKVLQRAVAHLMREDLDHLTVVPEVKMPNWFLDSFSLTFFLCFFIYFQPWKARERKSGCYVGVGAFNLVRSGVLRGLGGFSRLRMRPDDDVMLGRLIKRNGFHQEFLYGDDLLTVPWYPSISATVQGLMKNAFSGLNYDPKIIIGSTLTMALLLVFPFAAIFFVPPPAHWLYLAVVAILLAQMAIIAIRARKPIWVVLAFPLTVLFLIYIEWRAMLTTYWQDGVVWRGTHYPLSELRKNHIETV